MFFSGLLIAAAMMFQTDIDDTGTAVARPMGNAILEPDTGSYYQVFEFYGRPPYTWEHANRMVKGYHYQGREGRLAEVKSGNTHYFLLVNFPDIRTNPMWIGLHVECNETAEIKWQDGSSLSEQSFRAWNDGTPKNISRTCREHKESGMILPVFYQAHELGVRWEVAQEKANMKYMMVEFPVPTEAEQEKTDTAKP
ncbi:C-type lectin domain-containing protein [Kordiimonas pumila]|uniref:C-type lectin domain-containing protein n=1 Tax=Kordiimonas pumila TaxID=2161677 RepID=A0ABV7D3H6_9PROT|nr:C-type lectin domain-containing protein [Kordiimonas pumila]